MLDNLSFIERCGLLGFIIWFIHVSAKIYETVKVYYYGKFDLKNRLKSYGKWAVITGCTRGLGIEFSRQFAGLGLNLVLVARNQSKLDELATEISKKYGVQIRKVVMDLDKFPLNVDPLVEQLKDKDIGILVNNAGVMVERPEEAWNLDATILRQIITVNINALQTITLAVLNKVMIPKGKGLIVTLSSGGAHQPAPLLAPYAASKKYVEYLTLALKMELRESGNSGIHCQVLNPSFIATSMTAYNSLINTPSLFSPNAETYVRAAMNTLGTTTICTGYFPHTVQTGLSNYVPQFCRSFGTVKIMNFLRQKPKNA